VAKQAEAAEEGGKRWDEAGAGEGKMREESSRGRGRSKARGGGAKTLARPQLCSTWVECRIYTTT
jgi:hypothetical protein